MQEKIDHLRDFEENKVTFTRSPILTRIEGNEKSYKEAAKEPDEPQIVW